MRTVAVSIREKGTGADKFCLRSDSDGLPPPRDLGGKALQPGKTEAPAPPLNVRLSRTKAGHAALAWKPGKGLVAGFVIERSGGDAKLAPVDFVPADATSWTDPILLPAAAQYRVRAFGPGGASEPAGR